MNKSSFCRINVRDLLHAFIITFLAAALTGVIESLDSGVLPTLAGLKKHAILGLTAGLSYVLKVFLENSKGEILKKEQ